MSSHHKTRTREIQGIKSLNYVHHRNASKESGHRVGMASALYGTLQWGMATLASFMVSRLHNGTLIPMTGVIFSCGLISTSVFHFLVLRQTREKQSA